MSSSKRRQVDLAERLARIKVNAEFDEKKFYEDLLEDVMVIEWEGCARVVEEEKRREQREREAKQANSEKTVEVVVNEKDGDAPAGDEEELSDEQEMFECPEPRCGKVFLSQGGLHIHHTREHTDRFVCEKCSKHCGSHAALEVHMNNHTGYKPFHCDEKGCSKRFFTNHLLQRHKQSDHGQVMVPKKTFKCGLKGCDKRFSSKARLAKHKKCIHKDQKPIVCPQKGCGQIFKSNAALKQHLTSHSQQRLFECPVDGCHKAFATRSKCNRHRKRHYQGQLRCPIDKCSKVFKSSEELKKHVKTHQSHALVCPTCNKTFTLKKKFKKHQLKHNK